ncbi:MAG TPA: FAD-binding oxidoreductase [Mycobacteriales bacterium]|nr:FAD-binding oxidoreductase [Mycobacteriales bacterium]
METSRPRSVEELSTALRDSSGTVRARGGGTKWSWGASTPNPDMLLDLTAMNDVVEHASGDLVVTVQAGTSLTDLQTALGAAGQWLSLDPPERHATVGGVVSTATSGPRRLRFGTPRDLLIGVTVVLADGTIARSGGKVVKNVAGYDLGKLVTGAFGTLGVIAECTFRLHPVAPARRVVSLDVADPGPLVGAVLRSPLEPAALEWDGERLHALFETVEGAAESQARDLLSLAGRGEVGDALPEAFGSRPWRDGDVALKVTHRLSSLSPVVDVVRRRLPGCRLVAHAGSGVIHAAVAADATDVAASVDELRREVGPHDGSVLVLDAPPDVKAGIDVWGPVRGLEVMRRVKAQFDPDARMSPGRFVGGI